MHVNNTLQELSSRLNKVQATERVYSVSCSLKHIAIGVGDLGFDSRASQLRRSVTDGSPPLRRSFGAVIS